MRLSVFIIISRRKKGTAFAVPFASREKLLSSRCLELSAALVAVLTGQTFAGATSLGALHLLGRCSRCLELSAALVAVLTRQTFAGATSLGALHLRGLFCLRLSLVLVLVVVIIDGVHQSTEPLPEITEEISDGVASGHSQERQDDGRNHDDPADSQNSCAPCNSLQLEAEDDHQQHQNDAEDQDVAIGPLDASSLLEFRPSSRHKNMSPFLIILVFCSVNIIITKIM